MPVRPLARVLGVCAAAYFGAACVGDIGAGNGSFEDGPGGSGGPGPNGGFAPAEASLVRLTRVQLENSWRALLGEPLVTPDDLPDDDLLYGFSSIAAATRTISPLEAEQYESATWEVLEQVWSDTVRRDALVGCAPTSIADPCVAAFVSDLGQAAWRRPLTDSEVEGIVAVGEKVAASTGDVWQGVRFAAGTLLQSPHFLFRVEIGAPDEATGLLRYTSWEMASRLSFLITDAPPDAELLQAAEAGELDDPAQVEAQAQRLLTDDRARPALVRFFRDFMNIGRLDQLDKSAELFPAFSATLGPAMRLEIERMFELNVFERRGDFRDLFTTRETYLNEELAKVYGIEGITGADLTPVTHDAGSHRAGLLTTAGFLAMNAHKTATSPTHRGRFVRVNLLCGDVPPPPPGVDTTLPAADPGTPQTLRQQLEKHRSDPACTSCHEMMDPIGFAFENYDALGTWRTKDNGLPVDATTEVEGTELEGGVELGALVAQLPEVGACVARRFYQHATAHLDDPSEKKAVDKLVADFVSSDYDFQQLVLALVTNDGFRFAAPQGEE
ncbi:MAG: DUF1592 domain-containing protein [Polyangiaceae bacterium]